MLSVNCDLQVLPRSLALSETVLCLLPLPLNTLAVLLQFILEIHKLEKFVSHFMLNEV